MSALTFCDINNIDPSEWLEIKGLVRLEYDKKINDIFVTAARHPQNVYIWKTIKFSQQLWTNIQGKPLEENA